MADAKQQQVVAPAGVWKTIKPFVNGGASGMLATCVIQPIDMVKVKIQLGEGSAGQVTKKMLANEGIGSFYKGLSAGLLRQATYTTARLGSFRVLTNKAVEANDGKPLPLVQKAFISLTAGAIGACVGSPADLALIRMQADSTLPAAQRSHYKNAFHTLYRIIADEGVLALWKGAGPTVVRAMSLNVDQSVELFRDKLGAGEIQTVVGARAISGFFAAACSLPFDYVKTQIQKMQPNANGKYPSLDCAMQTFKSGGPLKFYTGFPVYCVRIAPHVDSLHPNRPVAQQPEKSSKLFSGRGDTAMAKPAMATGKFSSYHLAAALRREPDPAAALRLFLGPPNTANNPTPFRYSLRCYDLIISKLAAARLFPAMESLLSSLRASSLHPREPLLCCVISAYGRARLPAAARRAFAHSAFPAPRTARALNALLHALLSCRTPLVDLLSICREASISPDACTYNILMRAAATSGSVEHARLLFDEMLQRRIAPTVVTFGTLVAAFCECGRLEEAFDVKEVMARQYNVMPNAHVYASLVKGLCQRGDVDNAVRLKEEMVGKPELGPDSAIYATLVRALFQVGRKKKVVGLLEEMKERGIPADRVVYNAMIAGFCEDEKDLDAAFAVLDDMEKSGCKADVLSYNTLVAGLCKLGRLGDSNELVEDMPRRGCLPDVVTYRMLFDGMCAAGEFYDADQVLDEMVFKGFAPSKDSVRKFVQGIEKEGDAVLLESVLCRLAKVNALEPSGWEKAVGGMLNDLAELIVEKQLDSLRFTY